VFYFSLAGAVLGLAGTLFTGFAPHSPRGLLLLFGVALFATTAQLAMTRAFGKGSTLLAAALQYSAIVFASGLGVLVFGDTLPPSGWAGIGIIVVSGVAATVLSSRAAARERAALATTDA
jgi:S-adenosylmethionine uptake transporter